MPRKSAAARAISSIATFPTRLKPPGTLSEPARKEFLRIVAAEAPDHFRASDLPLLEEYCEAAALARRAATELQSEAAAARWLAVWEKATRVMTALSMRLRLSPQARMPNNPKRPERLSYYERMALEEADNADGEA